MKQKRTCVIAVAQMYRDGRFLLTQRLPGKHFEFQWEFPGGKVEAGESSMDAVIREMEEELGFTPTEAVFSKQYELDIDRIFVEAHVYLIPPPVAFQLKDVHGLGWFTMAEMKELALTPTNQVWLWDQIGKPEDWLATEAGD